ncbi:hypothetical protein U1Q18_012287 [Sarracenia purpurea var. burkii]
MASPAVGTGIPKLPSSSLLADGSSEEVSSENGGEGKLGFKKNRPVSLVVAHSPMFVIPPGLSPSGLLDSPGFFSPLQSPFGMTHQQALAQVTAQAALSQSYMHIEAEHQSSSSSSLEASADTLTYHQPFSSNTSIHRQVHTGISEPESSAVESSEVSQSDRKSPPPVAVVKPANDGYNWRKYGQKRIKASEYPRSYYRCTHLNCPVKKKVGHNFGGQITEITYKGHHNHELPQSNKRSKDGIDSKSNTNGSKGTSHSVYAEDDTQPKPLPLVSSDHVALGDIVLRLDEGDDDKLNPKRRYTEDGASELTSSHRTVTEPRIVVQTRSEVDLLDDGYKWRKYGQKVVKGNANPRSYYKCSYLGCNVRKHVERASSDSKAVVTTYEGKHNHDVPAARKSGYNTANCNTLQLKSDKVVAKKPALLEEMEFGNSDQRSVLVQLKEDQIVA